MDKTKGEQMPPPHLNISGNAGAGKTTVSSSIATRWNSLWIPRVTSRLIRYGEKEGTEYLFLIPNVFLQKKNKGEIIFSHPGVQGDTIYHVGILRPDLWPEPKAETDLMISIFGSFAPDVKRIRPEMINIFLTVEDERELDRRLTTRKGVDPSYRQSLNAEYKKKKIHLDYDYVIYNDGPVEETVEKIEKIVGLSRSTLGSTF